MKKYIQPATRVVALQMESVIASSVLDLYDVGTEAAPLSHSRRNPWEVDNWLEPEE